MGDSPSSAKIYLSRELAHKGLSCTKAGDTALQVECAGFDSQMVHHVEGSLIVKAMACEAVDASAILVFLPTESSSDG